MDSVNEAAPTPIQGPPRRKGCLKKLLFGALAITAGAEVFLRARYGLGNPPLYLADAKCGYRSVPSRSYHRFGNRFTINALSQRSEHDPKEKPQGVTRVLCLGDSITNGGVQTDDAQTYPRLLEDNLNAAGKGRWETFNASSGGWALGNELGYLEEFGTCKADIVVLQVAAHDLYQPTSPSSTAGTRTFPTTSPPLALIELFDRYLIPRLFGGGDPPDPGVVLQSRSVDKLAANQKILEQEVAQVRAGGATPVVWFIDVPPRSKAGVDLSPDSVALDAMTRQMTHLKVPVLNFTSAIDSQGGDKFFRDALHPNPDGNRVIAGLMAETLVKMR